MSQSWAHSHLEAAANTVVGFVISWAATLLILPLFGLPVSAGAGFGITCCFAAISYARGLVLRRVFNRWGSRRGRA